MASRFAIETIFKGVDQMTAPVKRMEKGVGGFARKTERSILRLNKRLGGMVSAAKSTAFGVVVALAPIGLALADIIRTGARFEQSLVNAAAKFPGEIRKGTIEFEKLSDAARKVGRETEFRATEAAEALNFLAMAGFTAEQSIGALPGIVDLATAAQIDLATASDIATDSLGAFNLLSKDAAQQSKNLARINDVLVQTANSANTSVEQLFSSFIKVGPVATKAGADIETTSAILGALAGTGIKAEDAGTALRNVFLAISAPTSRAGKLFRALGVATTDINGDVRDAVDVFGDLSKRLKTLPSGKQLIVLNEIFGKRGVASAANIGDAVDGIRKFREELRGAAGISTKLAGVMRDTLEGRMKALGSAIESVKITTFGLTEGPLADVVDRMTAWVRVNETFIADNIGGFMLGIADNLHIIIPAVKLAAAAFGILLAVFVITKIVVAAIILLKIAWVAIIVVLVVAVLALAAAFFLLTSPVGLLILGIGLLIGLGVLLVKKWEPVKAFFVDLWETISNVVGGVARGVAGFFGFGDDEESAGGGEAPQVVSPQARTARSIEESRSTSTAEITIRDESNRAEITEQSGAFPGQLKLAPTGGF